MIEDRHRTSDRISEGCTNSAVSIELGDLQQQFKQYLMSHSGTIANHISSTSELSNQFRLDIYANAYRSRLVETLQKDYPVLDYMLGEEAFTRLAHKYINTYPSTHPSLRWFGQALSRYIADDPDYETVPFLAELATLEWQLVDAFNAADAGHASEADAARVPADAWPELMLEFHPSVHYFNYQWNIIPLWQSHQKNQTPPAPIKLAQIEVCLVWRNELATRYRTLAPDESLVFELMDKGANFTRMCETLAAVMAPEDVAMRAASLLKAWLGAGLISKITW